jgi:hypothetical protein
MADGCGVAPTTPARCQLLQALEFRLAMNGEDQGLGSAVPSLAPPLDCH